MKKFELLPHTADVAVKATGSSREELFSAAMQGMFEAASPRSAAEGASVPPSMKVERKFLISSSEEVSLLVDLLNEAIYLSATHGEAYDDIEFATCTLTNAAGVFKGRAVEGFATEIKAATYHDLKIEKSDGLLTATIVFDV